MRDNRELCHTEQFHWDKIIKQNQSEELQMGSSSSRQATSETQKAKPSHCAHIGLALTEEGIWREGKEVFSLQMRWLPEAAPSHPPFDILSFLSEQGLPHPHASRFLQQR